MTGGGNLSLPASKGPSFAARSFRIFRRLSLSTLDVLPITIYTCSRANPISAFALMRHRRSRIGQAVRFWNSWTARGRSCFWKTLAQTLPCASSTARRWPSNNQCRFDDSSCQARPNAIAQSITTANNAIMAEILSMESECRTCAAVRFEVALTRGNAQEPKYA
jgi:hypothetical protein